MSQNEQKLNDMSTFGETRFSTFESKHADLVVESNEIPNANTNNTHDPSSNMTRTSNVLHESKSIPTSFLSLGNPIVDTKVSVSVTMTESPSYIMVNR